MDSILTSIKKMLGIEDDFTNFDTDIIININSVLLSINQIGVGPEEGYIIKGKDEVWTDLLGDRKDLEAIKTYIYLKVRLLFDPPTNSFVLDSMNRQITEFEWRITIQSPKVEGGVI